MIICKDALKKVQLDGMMGSGMGMMGKFAITSFKLAPLLFFVSSTISSSTTNFCSKLLKCDPYRLHSWALCGQCLLVQAHWGGRPSPLVSDGSKSATGERRVHRLHCKAPQNFLLAVSLFCPAASKADSKLLRVCFIALMNLYFSLWLNSKWKWKCGKISHLCGRQKHFFIPNTRWNR